MKWNVLTSTILVASLSLLLQSGCEEQAAVRQDSQPALTPRESLIIGPIYQTPPGVRRGTPRITFERVLHDFGQVSPETRGTCEFKFTNTGDAVLKILEVTKSCGCTPYSLDKTEYAPGESGTLKVAYYPGSRPGATSQELAVLSNDSTNPKVDLTVEAKVIVKVFYEPAALDLVAKDSNTGCPPITLTSLDNKPFSIKGFRSTANSMTLAYDASQKATKFVIQPKIDVAKLKQGLDGLIEIELTHPECNKITIPFVAPPKYQIDPPTIVVFDAQPQQPVLQKVRLLNNYGGNFQIESVSSRNNLLKVLHQKKIANGYELDVQVTPPASQDKSRVFTDTLSVNLRGGEKVQTAFNGFYVSKAAASRTSSAARTPRKELITPQTSVGTEPCTTCPGKQTFYWREPKK